VLRQNAAFFPAAMASQIMDILLWILRSPSEILTIAMVLLCIQLWWLRRHRSDGVAGFKFDVINPTRFAVNWIACGLLAAVGLPTLTAFFFAVWLGPWYLYVPEI
jgi:hypothetical protein